MKKVALLLVLFFAFNRGYSQKIHSNMEIIKIMADSKLVYDIKMLDKPIKVKDNSDKLNYHDCYRVVSDSDLTTNQYNVNELAKPLFDKAESFFKFQKPDSALFYYKSALDADSSLYFIMTYIGQIYEKRGESDNSIYWYKKSISKNYIDYMAHWFLADNLMEKNDLKNAVDEIIIARILNRNNPRIIESMENIFKKAKKNSMDWYFNPQMEIIKTSEKKISIAMNQKWTSYAMAKALWMFEPGYRDSMGVSTGQYSTLEDRECLIALLEGIENAKINIKNEPQFSILKEAALNGHLDSYILYEIVLPQTPFVAFQLPEKTILEIKDYILNVRNK